MAGSSRSTPANILALRKIAQPQPISVESFVVRLLFRVLFGLIGRDLSAPSLYIYVDAFPLGFTFKQTFR